MFKPWNNYCMITGPSQVHVFHDYVKYSMVIIYIYLCWCKKIKIDIICLRKDSEWHPGVYVYVFMKMYIAYKKMHSKQFVLAHYLSHLFVYNCTFMFKIKLSINHRGKYNMCAVNTTGFTQYVCPCFCFLTVCSVTFREMQSKHTCWNSWNSLLWLMAQRKPLLFLF